MVVWYKKRGERSREPHRESQRIHFSDILYASRR